MKLLYVSLCLVVVLNECLAKRCIDDDTCLSKVGSAFKQMLTNIISGGDYLSQCPAFEQSTHCLKDCEAVNPDVSKLKSIIDIYISEYCGENGKIFKELSSSCIPNSLLYEKCKFSELKPGEEVLCGVVDNVLCVARSIQEECEDRKGYGEAMEKRMMKRRYTCSGASNLANSFLKFVITVLSVLLIKNKLQ